MSLNIGAGKQILNVHYGTDMSSRYLNSTFFKVFLPGILFDGEDHNSFSFENNIITIRELSLYITPRNIPENILKVDTTLEFTKKWFPAYNKIFIARFEWHNDQNDSVVFLFVEKAEEFDIILFELALNDETDEYELNFDNQTIAELTLINPYASYTDADFLDCYTNGNEADHIPLNNSVLNENLNAEMINGISFSNFAVNDNTLQENLVTQYLQEFGIQPQDGLTIPGTTNQLPISNGILQVNLNCQYINGKELDYFTSDEHTHYYSQIDDSNDFTKADYVSDNHKLTSNSIKSDDISFTKLAPFAYDVVEGATFVPVVETGTVELTDSIEATVTFVRDIKNVRIFLQKLWGNIIVDEIKPYSERTAFIYEIGIDGFKVRQFPPFFIDDAQPIGSNYAIVNGPEEEIGGRTVTYSYIWVAVGERV